MRPVLSTYGGIMVVAACLLCPAGDSRGQSAPTGEVFNASGVNRLFWESTDPLLYDSRFHRVSATRFMPVLVRGGISSWLSPRVVPVLDGIPFQVFPLQWASSDLLPFPAAGVSPPVIGGGGFDTGYLFPGGGLQLHRVSIPDSFRVSFQFSAGSETGDPLVHQFTRPEIEIPNKNRFGPYVAGLLSDNVGDVRYRVSAGISPYFSTDNSSQNIHAILSGKISDKSREQNVHLFGSAEIEASLGRSSLVLVTGIRSFKGWEVLPFLSTFTLVSGHVNSVRAIWRTPDDNLSFAVWRDGSFLKMEAETGTIGGDLSLAEYGLSPGVRYDFSGIGLVGFNVEARFLTARSGGPLRPDGRAQFFAQPQDEWRLGASASLTSSLSAHMNSHIDARIDHRRSSRLYPSGSVALAYELDSGHVLAFTLSSTIVFPSLHELFAGFSTARYRPTLARSDTFTVTGSPSLTPERVTNAQMSFRGDLIPEILTFWATLSHVGRGDPILQEVYETVRSEFPGDIVHNGVYKNGSTSWFSGMTAGFRGSISRDLVLGSEYSYSGAGRDSRYPQHRGIGFVEYGLLESVWLMVSGHYQSRTFWPEFLVVSANNDKDGVPVDGTSPSAFVLDIAGTYRVPALWMLRDVALQIRVDNILNREHRPLPIGNSLDTAVAVDVAFTL